MIDKVPPHDLEAERAVLGAALLNNEALQEDLPPDAFYRTGHGVIHKAMLEMDGRGDPIDFVTLISDLRDKGMLDKIGGEAYISELTNEVPSISHASHYAKTVSKLSRLRKIIRVTAEISANGYKAGDSVDDYLEEAAMAVQDISDNEQGIQYVTGIRDIMKETSKYLEDLYNGDIQAGISLGFKAIDYLHVQAAPGDLVIIGGRSGMGKTSFMLDSVRHSLVQGLKVLVFSYEMTKRELGIRLISQMAKIDSTKFRGAKFGEGDYAKMSAAMGNLVETNLFVVDDPRINVLQMQAIARRMKRKHGIDAIWVDYLQKVPPSKAYRGDKRLETAEVSNAGKNMAKVLQIPVFMLVQLLRTVDERVSNITLSGGTRAKVKGIPHRADIKEAGDIEQDADTIGLLWRAEHYLKEETPHEMVGVAHFIVDKSRHGPIGKCKLKWLGQYTSFADLDNRY